MYALILIKYFYLFHDMKKKQQKVSGKSSDLFILPAFMC